MYNDDELISDEREWSDDQNHSLNDGSTKGLVGYNDEVPYKSAHSSRSRKIMYEHFHQWD